jgi:hypothetical protein
LLLSRIQEKVYVYVLNKHGKPLMPCSPKKARVHSSYDLSQLFIGTGIYILLSLC